MTDRNPSLTWTVVATGLGFAVVQLDVTIVNVALTRLGGALHSPLAGLQWVVDAYTLAFAVLLLSAGTLADRFGARRAYLIGFAVFGFASAACGAATSVTQLVVARAVQGLGAALLVPPSLALLNHACAHDRKLRARAIALWTAAGSGSIAVGPVIGGALLESFGWRSIFLANLPLCALGIGLTLRLPETLRTRRPLDLPGQVLAVLALTSLCGVTIEAGALGWGHPLILGGFALAVVSGAAFVLVEGRIMHPMLPLKFFRLPHFSQAVLLGVAVNLTYYGLVFVLSLYLQHVKHYSALQAGLAFVPLTATSVIANLVSGWLNSRFGARLPMLLGSAIGALGYLLLARLDENSSYMSMLTPFLLIPGGAALVVPAMTATILASVEPTWSGTASAVLNAARQAAGAIGVAVFGALVAGGDDHIVSGLRDAAGASVVMLVCAGVMVWLGIRPEDSAGFSSPTGKRDRKIM
ncbi:MFS transporter [Burkholderia ubonensis]|uniref:MFS transporter n=1 Tax=Burkholderia ubonensis TaxID=101571 RepID=A0A102JXV8_9BURK|nr:MFS transporter [Burkholderia ubonensis]KUZ64964.1 MFS transporter [Burkholderia ubonensis]KUZ82108.1 MFS transporter [Burkholderia ubonensis]KVA01357.1 MFS transporter [Burkholderia ubonensis]